MFFVHFLYTAQSFAADANCTGMSPVTEIDPITADRTRYSLFDARDLVLGKAGIIKVDASLHHHICNSHQPFHLHFVINRSTTPTWFHQELGY